MKGSHLIWCLLFFGCCGGNEVSVRTDGAEVTVKAEESMRQNACEVSVIVKGQPTIVPVFVPMPIPYDRSIVEKP